ncbi:MAG: hypothetical protein KAG56_02405 [Sulfurovaceae bacterium]|nr:hypothetical protein [Sulfurovaceae bacterium]
MLKKVMPILSIILLINGCTGKQVIKKENQESAFIIIKTPTMRYADMGFIYKKTDLVKVEIYALGQPLMNLDINSMNVCLSTFECMEKKDFNAKMLSAYYPDTVLENIFRAKPIFNKKNLEENSNGFTQNIKKDKEYDITYSVKSNKRVFRDTINKIKIEVRPK